MTRKQVLYQKKVEEKNGQEYRYSCGLCKEYVVQTFHVYLRRYIPGKCFVKQTLKASYIFLIFPLNSLRCIP